MPVETRSMLNKSDRSRRLSSRRANKSKTKATLAKNRSRRQSVKRVNSSKSKIREKQVQTIRERTASTQGANRSAKVSNNRDFSKSLLSPFRQFFTGFLGGGQDAVSKTASSPKSVDASAEAFEGTFAFGSAGMKFNVGAA